MKKFDAPAPVKLVCGLLYGTENWLHRGISDLKKHFGEIEFQSSVLNFTYTDYYFKEMGHPLFRVFITFAELRDPATLPSIKTVTNELEAEYASSNGGSRVLNIDPGFLTATAYILATSKNYAHRIYLGNGVFAQQELLFERRRIQTLDWTYPDYRSLEYQEIFKKLREMYLNQLKREPFV